jgi:hypothetical protein
MPTMSRLTVKSIAAIATATIYYAKRNGLTVCDIFPSVRDYLLHVRLPK